MALQGLGSVGEVNPAGLDNPVTSVVLLRTLSDVRGEESVLHREPSLASLWSYKDRNIDGIESDPVYQLYYNVLPQLDY